MGGKKDLADIRRVLFGSIFGIPFRMFVRVIKLLGYVFTRQSGSHAIYRHPKVPELLNIQPDQNNHAKRYQVDELRRRNQQYRLFRAPRKRNGQTDSD